MVDRLDTLRAASLEAGKRRADLRRWSANWQGEPGHYSRGIREGLGLAIGLVETGRFGPAEVCVHRKRLDREACAPCVADAAAEGGDELAILELEDRRRRERLAELAKWERSYAASSDDFGQGVAVGLSLAGLYLAGGMFGTPIERAEAARQVFDARTRGEAEGMLRRLLGAGRQARAAGGRR